MPQIELRLEKNTKTPGDLVLEVQEKTFDYLLTSPSETIRVSSFCERDWPRVETQYAEVFVADDCKFESHVTQIIPGSRTRKVALPGPMMKGEQLTLLLKRNPIV